jgi:ATP-dependent RNA helicase HelY
MSINLISQFGSERARTSLESSLAQFQADKAVVGLAKQIRKNESVRDGLYSEAKCHLGNFLEYAQMRGDIKKLETDSKRSKRKRHLHTILSTVSKRNCKPVSFLRR